MKMKEHRTVVVVVYSIPFFLRHRSKPWRRARDMMTELLAKLVAEEYKPVFPQFDETFQSVAGRSAKSIAKLKPHAEAFRLQRDQAKAFA